MLSFPLFGAIDLNDDILAQDVIDVAGKTGQRRNGKKALFPFSEGNDLWLVTVDTLDKLSEN